MTIYKKNPKVKINYNHKNISLKIDNNINQKKTKLNRIDTYQNKHNSDELIEEEKSYNKSKYIKLHLIKIIK